jgi:hypothetical protein
MPGNRAHPSRFTVAMKLIANARAASALPIATYNPTHNPGLPPERMGAHVPESVIEAFNRVYPEYPLDRDIDAL